MSFDIQKHLQDHADYYKKYKEIHKDDLHFKFSVLDLYFVANNYDPKAKLNEILKELKAPKEYIIREKNGFYKGKQKFANRNHKINLNEKIKIEAIHTRGLNGEYTMPHIHLILDKNARLGKDYSLLKHHISKVLREHNLIPSFDEINKDSYKYKALQKAVSKFFWSLKQADNNKFKKYIADDKKLTIYLDHMYEYAKQSNNLSYFFKTLNYLQSRLNALNIDFMYKQHNLKNTYPVDFILKNDENKEVLEILTNKDFTQKNIKKYKDNAILRDAVRYTINKKNALIINQIKEKTHLLDNFRKNTKLLDNYKKVLAKELPNRQTKTKIKESGLHIYKNAFNKAINIAKNEKELRELLNKDFKFSFKKRKGKTIGFTFNSKYVSFNDLGYNSIAEIRKVLIQNNINNQKEQEQELQIKYKTAQIEANKLKRKQNVELTRKISKFDKQIESRESKISSIDREIESRKSEISRTESKIIRTESEIKSRETRNMGFRNTIKQIKNRFKEFGERILEFGRRIKQLFVKENHQVQEQQEQEQEVDINNDDYEMSGIG